VRYAPATRCKEYYIDDLARLVGILQSLIRPIGMNDSRIGKLWHMAFADFNLEMAVGCLDLTLSSRVDLFAGVVPLEIPPILQTVMERWAPQAMEVNTEKARSELIIAPILMEAAHLTGGRLGVYSGVSLDVDRDRGLFGRCDFLVGRKAGPFLLGSPLLAVVEAKNEDIPGNLGQCIAEMVAVRELNERKGNPIPVVHGTVITGAEWLFLRLDGNNITFDSRDRSLDDLGKILAYLSAIGAERTVNPSAP
jgi:hypothetical protein